MAKVTLVLEINETLCKELNTMRDMVKNLDFSGLKRSIEKVQVHGNAMEDALYRYNEVFDNIEKVFDESKREDWDGSSKWDMSTANKRLDKIKELIDNRKIKKQEAE